MSLGFDKMGVGSVLTSEEALEASGDWKSTLLSDRPLSPSSPLPADSTFYGSEGTLLSHET